MYEVALVSKIKFDMHCKSICNSIGFFADSANWSAFWLAYCADSANRSAFQLASRDLHFDWQICHINLHFDWQIAICISIGKPICILICVSICKLCWITKSTCSSVCILPIYNRGRMLEMVITSVRICSHCSSYTLVSSLQRQFATGFCSRVR